MQRKTKVIHRHKSSTIKELLNENLIDMIFIAESKLDDTFRNSEFNVENYHLWRADRNASGGGLLVYIPHCNQRSTFI
jgi:hypothetical protein